ncbi:MAG TPA: ABC transporter ATP-binding protein, partial [Trueperaceae bacterium]|nr:ABC transporter ATP-binding protein [Trueperaceae bacterium]
QITQQLQELQKAGAGVQRIGELMGMRSALPRDGTTRLPKGPLSVEFDDVSFHYPDVGPDQLTLDGVSFRLAPGTRVGLLGRTGSGKTTLTRLLFRLYDPTGGSVLLSGTDAKDADLDGLRARVGLVSQEVQLFRGTLRHNLSFFDDSVSDERILAVLSELGMTDWLERQDDGLDTLIDSGGRNLSAGEAQLIAFARVFLADPGLIVLDEPSSRLDPATERRLEAAMERLLAGRTAIVIAHRLETVERVDEILVMDRGRLVEHGRRDRLAQDPDSRYARLRKAALSLDLALAGREGLASHEAHDEALEELA